LNVLEVQPLVHWLLHLYVSEEAYSYHSIDVNYKEHQAAHVDKRREGVDESGKDNLELF